VAQDSSSSPEEFYQNPIENSSNLERPQKVIITHKTKAVLDKYKYKALSRKDLDHDDRIYIYNSERIIDTEKLNKNKTLPRGGAKSYNPYMRASSS
jgi:hypothetical protein